MTKAINITIENNLIKGRRDMNIYHHATRSAHMISYCSSVTLPFPLLDTSDYLYLSIVSGPGHMKIRSMVELPTWIDFEFLSEGKLKVTHSVDRTFLKIPSGLPGWQLKLTQSGSVIRDGNHRVIISEDWKE